MYYAEQFIGMSGSGFASGLAIASYEWMAALTLIIVGKYFLPIFIEKGLYTIPEFVEKRFSTNLKTILAVFWLALYVFVNLTSVLYLGGLAIETIMGVDMIYAVIGLALFAAAYSLYGGLSAVAWTDVIQVVFLVLGGLATTYLALNTVSGGEGIIAGFSKVVEAAPEKFHMVLEEFTGDGSKNPNYLDLPGVWVLIGGLWVANIYYWGFNQYIIQRTLAAKSLKESQKGILLAAFLKLIIPLIVVVPGIAAYVMVNDPEIMASLGTLIGGPTDMSGITKKIEEVTGLELCPTYSYQRIYKQGQELDRHKDRPSCEISVTMNLGGDPWPIYLEPSGKEGQKGIKVDLKPGDMLVYSGC